MGKCCVAYGCSNQFKKGSDIKFHYFPKDSEQRKKWVNALRRENFTPSDNACICSVHFLPTDYKDDEFGYIRRRLKDDAVPSVFPAFPSHLQPPTKKRRVLVRNSPEDASTSASADNLIEFALSMLWHQSQGLHFCNRQ